MIVRKQDRSIVCIAQHDHAQLSGWFAALWGSDQVPALPEPAGALRLAAIMHDVGWIPLDQNPQWDNELDQPYSFTNLPAPVRVRYYREGVDMVERIDPYAALLCSRHYTTFFPPASTVTDDGVRQFLIYEAERQSSLTAQLKQTGRETELARKQNDLELIKLWDSMSLYVALNEPGVSKEHEHPWYRKGFDPITVQSAADGDANPETDLRLTAQWLDRERIFLDPFPLAEPFAYPLPVRVITRDKIEQEGLLSAFRSVPVQVQVVRFVAKKDV